MERPLDPSTMKVKVQGKYIKEPNKPLEDYEKKVKAWRLIGNPYLHQDAAWRTHGTATSFL